ncbi:hypothetical protein [Enterococcus dongliensis]|uniref:hypothetical protein n=1 Tax=Enterococcus dongliensis TaxID=2559925 RepID=UPI00288CC020|nr:hypothetical protein [Enterococcus dongliensis]MDT2604953.1 hypothetical protein [Enterococcus dongliensis]MDT2645613.1 hypothetical protein [Enterococcus dongliensis]MDT2676611.1 hypothetical protein [Enterococcus dongliensis]MDT2710745.1 hypothetical protein [Enterococcus dongliensis]
MSNDLANEFAIQQSNQGNSVMANTAVSREMEEVKGQIFMAKQFPRNPFEAEKRIIDSCKRRSLASTAMYSYPRGKTNVQGPSIRLAEVLAQNWGNISFGVKELEQRPGESVAMAYAWDVETNTRQEKIFTVPHLRYTKYGTTKLEDPRDIYEMVANNGSRRLRACILGVIPGDIVELAIEECNKTLAGENASPLKDRLSRAFTSFKENFDVTQEMIEDYFGYKSHDFSEKNFSDLIGIFNSLKDGNAKVKDYFVKTSSESKSKNDIEKEFVDKKESSQEEKQKGSTAVKSKVDDNDGPQQEELL